MSRPGVPMAPSAEDAPTRLRVLRGDVLVVAYVALGRDADARSDLCRFALPGGGTASGRALREWARANGLRVEV